MAHLVEEGFQRDRLLRTRAGRIDCGIVMPRAFAALRLMIRSNFDGSSIARSPGLAPFRILATKARAFLWG